MLRAGGGLIGWVGAGLAAGAEWMDGWMDGWMGGWVVRFWVHDGEIRTTRAFGARLQTDSRQADDSSDVCCLSGSHGREGEEKDNQGELMSSGAVRGE